MSVDVLQAVRTSVAELLGLCVADVDADANLFDLGLDSISVVMLVSILRKTYGFDLGSRAAFKSPSVSGLAAAIQAQSLGGQKPWM